MNVPCLTLSQSEHQCFFVTLLFCYVSKLKGAACILFEKFAVSNTSLKPKCWTDKTEFVRLYMCNLDQLQYVNNVDIFKSDLFAFCFAQVEKDNTNNNVDVLSRGKT